MEVYCIVDKTIVLDTPTPKTYLAAPLAYDNTKAHSMRVTVKNKNGGDADLTGIGVTATMKLEGNNTTVTAITGTVSGNVAQVILPAACYAVPGYYTFNMDFTKSGGYNRTVLWVEGTVEKNTSGTPIDPGTSVTNYSTIIANANAAASAANAAASSANSAASAASSVAAGAVQYNTTQSLTAAQKTRARANIGAATATDDQTGLLITV